MFGESETIRRGSPVAPHRAVTRTAERRARLISELELGSGRESHARSPKPVLKIRLVQQVIAFHIEAQRPRLRKWTAIADPGPGAARPVEAERASGNGGEIGAR